MPRKDKPQFQGRKPDPKPFEFQGFISCSMSDEDKAAFQVWSAQQTFEGHMEHVLEMIDRNYKFTVSMNTSNNAVIATYTCNNAAVHDFGWALSGFGPDMPTALAVLNFKHFVMLEQSWVSHARPTKQYSGIG